MCGNYESKKPIKTKQRFEFVFKWQGIFLSKEEV